MYLHWLIFSLASIWRGSACNSRQYAEAKIKLWKDLGLEDNSTQNERMWPLMYNYKYESKYADQPADIHVDIYVSSITNVNEKAQSLTTQLKMITVWPNVRMMWNPANYCQIETFAAPKNMFWTPDIGILESIKTEYGTKESPYVHLRSSGVTISTDIFALTTACKMDLYRFPFDTQKCSITLQSAVYSDKEIVIKTLNANHIINKSKEIFESQGEWNLINIIHSNKTTFDGLERLKMHQLIYEIEIKRRPVLYVINIIIPSCFLLVLDVISFFVDSKAADKVAFKVTLLLSVSVMLLIINNTLPSTGREIPLIGVYCGVIFCLIGISIMETIFVNYLKYQAAKKRSVETTADLTGRDVCVRDQQNPPDSFRDQNEEQSCTPDCLKLILNECRQITPLSLTKKARIINVIFLTLYIFTDIVFMSVLWSYWYIP
ncbi:5-hydroxytryptamine receptor 3A-like [Pimephales promelas]|uniref:5-hydroxytryptamine receptor 3A-like n=1 Tax=Pimephales promelas TaxID=90988 RepID=UPI0019555CFF|nr:5-hydroxytryptamine receptor 3A-like [Pimephales promelas]